MIKDTHIRILQPNGYPLWVVQVRLTRRGTIKDLNLTTFRRFACLFTIREGCQIAEALQARLHLEADFVEAKP